MSKGAKPYDILVTENYENKEGEEKTNYYKCGVAFDIESGGMSCKIPDGISLSGRFVILPRREKLAAEAE